MPWDDGYVSQIEYDHGYYQTLNPLAIKLAMLAHGYQPPSGRPFRYLELGFGQGLSLNIHAAAGEGEFWGNDFMPSQAVFAKTMAEASGAPVTITDDSFAQLAARDDLPEFNMIVLYGIWTWVSGDNREIILKIIETKLALGGVVYISYNTSPGATAMIPVRDLMRLHANTMSPKGSRISTNIKNALSFIQQLAVVNAAYLDKTPAATTRLNEIMKKDKPEYLAHEYFGDHWAIMPFSEVAAQLSKVGLQFCGNAVIRHFFSSLLLPDKIKSVLATIKDPFFYESVLDFCVNQSFRTDLWVKGGHPLSKLQRLHLLGEMRFTLVVQPPSEDMLALTTYLGTLALDKKMASLMLAALAENNFEPKSINTLLSYPSLKHLNLSQTCDMMLSLCGICVEPAQNEETIALLKPTTDKLNTFLINQAQCSDHILFLASPVTGGGISVPRIYQLSLLALRNGLSSTKEVAAFIWEILSSQGQFVIASDGRPCNGKDENIRELTTGVTTFFDSHLPILTALKIS